MVLIVLLPTQSQGSKIYKIKRERQTQLLTFVLRSVFDAMDKMLSPKSVIRKCEKYREHFFSAKLIVHLFFLIMCCINNYGFCKLVDLLN